MINIAFAGQGPGLVFEDEKRFDLVVRMESDKKKEEKKLKMYKTY